MSGAEIGLALSVFLACTVEAVEALTIVLAVGTTRSWSSALYGVGGATVVLAVVVAALGPALTSLPIGVLRLVVGGLLLVFGLQWLRKAILRATGLKALHDEAGIFAEQRRAAEHAGQESRRIDGYSFALSFKGVLLEGLEVVFIVLTFGANQHHVGIAAAAAGVAIVLVVLVGLAAKEPLTKVPENTMKFAVGVMLTSFGMFWGTEGAGAHWPGSDAALLVVIPAVALVAVATVYSLRRVTAIPGGAGAAGHGERPGEAGSKSVAGDRETGSKSVAGDREAGSKSVAGDREAGSKSVAGDHETNSKSVAGDREAGSKSVAGDRDTGSESVATERV